MVDQLTSWPIARAMPDKEATTIANAVYRDLILQHGAPEILLSDNGKEFSNDTLAYVCEEHGIKKHFTSPYKGKLQLESFVKKTMLHGIKCLIRSYAHIDFVLTPLLVKHLIHCSILETHLCQSTN